mgnify:CR=1 FL=1
MGSVSAAWAMAKEQIAMPLGATSSTIWVLGQPVDKARNMIVQKALELNAKYVMMIGDDTAPPPDIFIRLWRKQLPIVTALYTSRSSPVQPMIWNKWMAGPEFGFRIGEMIECLWCGMDAILFNTDVFRNITPPWFSIDYRADDGDPVPGKISLATEDLYACFKMRQAGYKIYCDTSIVCRHIDRNSGIEYTIPADWPQWDPQWDMKEDKILVADIGCGYFSPYWHKATVHRYDRNPDVNPDCRCDIKDIPCADNVYDKVYSRHALEHFPMLDTAKVLLEWIRILKVGGTLEISVPNAESAMRAILNKEDTEYHWWQIFGAQGEGGGHQCGFTKQVLFDRLASLGVLDEIEVSEKGLNIVATARKVKHNESSVIKPLIPMVIDAKPADPATLPPKILDIFSTEIKSTGGLKIDVGCGGNKIDESFLGVDLKEGPGVDYVADARALPFKDGEVSILVSNHLLEHFDRMEVADVLREFYRVLRPGGSLVVTLPDVISAMEEFMRSPDSVNRWAGLLDNVFGQPAVGMYHKTGFTSQRLQWALEGTGFEVKELRTYWEFSVDCIGCWVIKPNDLQETDYEAVVPLGNEDKNELPSCLDGEGDTNAISQDTSNTSTYVIGKNIE